MTKGSLAKVQYMTSVTPDGLSLLLLFTKLKDSSKDGRQGLETEALAPPNNLIWL